MRANHIPIEQQLINMINATQDFTYPLLTKRYIVGMESKFEGTNPSQQYLGIYNDVYKAVNEHKPQETFGGWLDKETGKYCVDSGMSFDDEDVALDWAKVYHQKAIYDSYDNKVIFVDKV